jgi:hypothetical protein
MKATIFFLTLFFLLTSASFTEYEIRTDSPLLIQGPKYPSDAFQTLNITILSLDESQVRYDLSIWFLNSWRQLVSMTGSNVTDYLTMGTSQFQIEIWCLKTPYLSLHSIEVQSCPVLVDYKVYTYDFMTIG